MPDALLFFDSANRCIWANRPAITMLGIKDGDFESASGLLARKFKHYKENEHDWSATDLTGEGDAVRSYVLENRAVRDGKQRVIGSFLRIRDNTAEQKTLQKEIYNATHDPLTGVYNRAGYKLLLEETDLKNTLLLLIDIDRFKEVNDTYGHEIGDKVLVKVTDTIRRHFRGEDSLFRIGGDEFIILMTRADAHQLAQIENRVTKINEALANGEEDGLPPVSISVGGAHGEYAADKTELFERADRALYETKRRGRSGYTLYIEKA